MNYKLLIAVPLMTLALNAQAGKGGVGAIFGALIGGAVGNAVGKSAGQRMTVDEALGVNWGQSRINLSQIGI